MRPTTRKPADGVAAPRPATRIGRTVVFQGGAIRHLSVWQWALFALGLRKSL